MENSYICDANFNKAVGFVLKSEGGYSNHKYDKGGATNYGITQASYNSFRIRKKIPPQEVKKITKDEAIKIYYEDYWLKSGADKVSDFALALVLFDSSVNHGVGCAKKLYSQSGGNVNKFLELRKEKYKKIVQANPTQKVFLKGWMNRINNLENYISSL